MAYNLKNSETFVDMLYKFTHTTPADILIYIVKNESSDILQETDG